MIKRIVCLVLTLILSLSCCAALADDPQPIETIPYEELPPAIDGQHHYLLLCVDQWTGKPHNLGNTDGIVIVTLDTRAHRVMLTSIIRDALVERPDGVIGRINYIAKNYGPEALCKVISQHVGVKIEKYLLFDFSQIASIVDFLGGVDIEITSTESNYLQRYAIPKDSTTPRLRGAGTYHFNGHSAVIYMRIRLSLIHISFGHPDRGQQRRCHLPEKCRPGDVPCLHHENPYGAAGHSAGRHGPDRDRQRDRHAAGG